MPRPGPTGLVRWAAPVAAAALLSGCSLKTMAVKTVANTLSETGDVFSRDNDPELVRDAVPFALKTYESLLESIPRHEKLLIATCSGFAQYGYAFVQTEAIVLGEARHDEVVKLNERALNLYVRGKDYCLRAMDVRFGAGTIAALSKDPAPVLARATKKDVPLLYWTAASWGLAIALGLDTPALVVDLPTVRALAERALALDDTWNTGALHEMMITLDSLPEAVGGSAARARTHFGRAVDIQKGASPGPYVALALGVSVAAQNEAEFRKLLDQALAIDAEQNPGVRLITLVTQRRARALLEQIDLLFVK